MVKVAAAILAAVIATAVVVVVVGAFGMLCGAFGGC
jgi:hypothetical protein